MSEPYEERLDGQRVLRTPPPDSHEILCDRIHQWVNRYLPVNSTLKRLPRRTAVALSSLTSMKPDLALVKDNENRAYLFAEVLLPGDHSADTVIKKCLCQQHLLPRLWIIDPRYLNVEVYASGPHGFRLETILANRDCLTDAFLPGLECSMTDLFRDA